MEWRSESPDNVTEPFISDYNQQEMYSEIHEDDDYDNVIFPLTLDDYNEFVFVVRCFLMPITGVIGASGNIYGLFMLHTDSKTQQNNFFFYMTALFIENTVQCVTNLMYNTAFIIERFDRDLGHYLETNLNLPNAYITKTFSHLAAGILILMSAERLFSLLQPFSFSTYSIFKHPRRVTLILLIISAISLIPYPMCCKPVEITNGNETMYALLEHKYMSVFMNQYVFYQAIFMSVVLPFIILVLNCSIPVAYYKYTHSTTKVDSKRRQQQFRITILTLSTAISYFILSLPNLMAFTLDFIHDKYSYFGKYGYFFMFFSTLATLFTNVNAMVDCVVYIVVTSNLWARFTLLCCGSGDPEKGGTEDSAVTDQTTVKQ